MMSALLDPSSYAGGEEVEGVVCSCQNDDLDCGVASLSLRQDGEAGDAGRRWALVFG